MRVCNFYDEMVCDGALRHSSGVAAPYGGDRACIRLVWLGRLVWGWRWLQSRPAWWFEMTMFVTCAFAAEFFGDFKYDGLLLFAILGGWQCPVMAAAFTCGIVRAQHVCLECMCKIRSGCLWCRSQVCQVLDRTLNAGRGSA